MCLYVTSGIRFIANNLLLTFCLILLSTLLLLPGCQNQVEDTDGDGWDNEREAVEGTNSNKRDSDDDGFSDPRDCEPVNILIPDDSEKTANSLIENGAIESIVKSWANNNIYGISRDIGDFIQVPVAKDALAQFIQTAMEKALKWHILHVDKSNRVQHNVKVTLEMNIKVPTAEFKDIVSGDIEVQDIISKGVDIANYRISVIYDLGIEDGKLISSEIDDESSGATLEENQ